MPKIVGDSYKQARRDFLKTTAKTGLLLSIGYPLIPISNRVWGSAGISSPVDLAVVTGDPGKAVRKAMDLLGGVKQFVKNRQQLRESAIPQAESIIKRRLDEFNYWYGHVLHEPIYNGHSNTIESLREEELAAIIGKNFFPSADETTQLLASFAVFGSGFLARPLGGIVIGRIGDLKGRRFALLLTIFLMAAGTVMMGLVPTLKRACQGS